MNKILLISILLIAILSGCSYFKDDEDVTIHNPKPGIEVEIKGQANDRFSNS